MSNYNERVKLYQELEAKLGHKLLVYVTNNRLNAAIDEHAISPFILHLNKIKFIENLSLYLYTGGGKIWVAADMANLLRQYCTKLQVIIPRKSHIAGTLLAVSADSIIMTEQATLRAFDPSLTSPLCPINPMNIKQTISVSLEDVRKYFIFITEELAAKNEITLTDIVKHLTEKIHPLVLGQLYREQVRIKQVTNDLLSRQVKNKAKIPQIVSFLCGDTSHHIYVIRRQEAKDQLGLNIISPSPDTDLLIQKIYDNINVDLQLDTALDAEVPDKPRRLCLLETVSGGSHYYYEKKGWLHDTING